METTVTIPKDVIIETIDNELKRAAEPADGVETEPRRRLRGKTAPETRVQQRVAEIEGQENGTMSVDDMANELEVMLAIAKKNNKEVNCGKLTGKEKEDHDAATVTE